MFRILNRNLIGLLIFILILSASVFVSPKQTNAASDFSAENLTSNIPGMTYVNAVAWNGSYWLIGGQGTRKLVKYDGITYTDLTAEYNSPDQPFSIGWNGSYWLIGGNGKKLVKYDGTTFTDYTSDLTVDYTYITSVVWNDSYWLIGGYGTRNLFKFDGTTFTNLSANVQGMAYIKSAWNGSYWLLCGQGTKQLVKYDGTIFTDLTSSISGMTSGAASVAWNGSYWLIGGQGTKKLVKYDGTTFTDLTSNVSAMNYITTVAWNGSYWLLAGNGTEKLVKYDGTTFTDLTSVVPNMTYGRALGWNGSYWLIGDWTPAVLSKLTDASTISNTNSDTGSAASPDLSSNSKHIKSPTFTDLSGTKSPINLINGQTIAVNPFVIQVKPTDSRYGILKVNFYIDNKWICTATKPDVSGAYACNWDTSKYQSDVKVVAYNKKGRTAELTRKTVVNLSQTSVAPIISNLTELPETGR